MSPKISPTPKDHAMTRWMNTACVLALMVLPLAASPTRAPTPRTPRAHATAMGCAINFKAHNNGRYWIAVSRDSQVKTRTGLWKKLGVSVWIRPGSTVHWTYNLTFGCNASRKWRLLLKQFSSYKGSLRSRAYACAFREDVYSADRAGYWSSHCSLTKAGPLTDEDVGDLNRFFQ
jgi:hypothetical protein